MPNPSLSFPVFGNSSVTGGDATYPTGTTTDPNFLKSSLGSFFFQIFEAQKTLQGYCTGLSEELLQAYQDLANAVYSLSVYEIPVYSKTIWFPIVIKKSQFNQSPFVFQPNGAVFGTQPSTSQFYANQIFQFGYPKSTTGNIYSFTPSTPIGEFSLIANNPFIPTSLYLQNVDVELVGGTFYFNRNPFTDPGSVILPVVNQNGVQATYSDNFGNVYNDQYCVLWAYNANLDNYNVYQNFGYIFGVNQPSSLQYKQLLQSFFNLAVEGATVLAFKSLLSYIGGIVPVINSTETVQYIATTEYNVVVTTDQHSYLYPLGTTLLPSVTIGSVWNAGDTFSNLYQVYDSVKMKSWWLTVFPYQTNAALPSNIFVGTYQNSLLFNNSLQLLSVGTNGTINFPVSGTSQDVATFEAYLNQTENAEEILSVFNLSPGQSTPVNPLDFIFTNFLQNNTTCVVLNFSSPNQASLFMTLFDEIRNYLPPYVFILMLVNVSVGTDIYNKLNNSTIIPNVSGTLNADGSNSVGNIASAAPYYYNSLERQFVLSTSPVNSNGSLLSSSNTQYGRCNKTTYLGDGLYTNDGSLFTTIPSSGANTINTPLIKFISFPGVINPYSGILNQLSVSAYWAYSLRRLNGNYYGPAILIRRDSDNTTTTIGFLPNGNLDTPSLLNFCGSANGFIVTQYDQTGNNRNSTQTTNANQPKIVSSGILLVQNNLPTIVFNGSTSYLNTFAFDGPNSNWSFNIIDTNYSSITDFSFSSGTIYQNGISIQNYGGDINIGYNPANNGNVTSFAPTLNYPYILTLTYNTSNNLNAYANGSNVGSFTINSGYSAGTQARFGFADAGQIFNGNIQESIAFQTTLSSVDRQTLEHNQEAYYSIAGI